MKTLRTTLGLSGITGNGKSLKLYQHETMGVAVFQTTGKGFEQQVSKWYSRKGNAINEMIRLIEK